jgi:hypothetical protein
LKTFYLLPFILLGRCVAAQSVSPLPVPSFPCTYTAKFSDALSMINNPAALVSGKSFAVGLYAQRRFMLAEPVQYIITAGWPLANAGLGMQVNYLRSGNYRQSEAGIAYAKKLGKIDLGARVNYHTISITGYGSTRVVVMDVGSIWHISDDLHAGMHVYNPVGGKLSYRYSAGFGYEVSEQVLLSLQLIKTENKPVTLNAGLHYQPAERIIIQTGISTATAEPYLAAGYQWKPWRLLISVSYHAQLGCSPALMFAYKPSKQ